MAGVYVHIPFCVQKCGYCDFYSITSLSLKDNFIKTIVKEIEYRYNEFQSEEISTIYMGGGTPSLMNKEDLLKILGSIKTNINPEYIKECTIEVNPDDITESYLKDLMEIGFNRLSIGIQSFNNRILKFMNRRHDSNQAIKAVELAQKVGFSNISIDLIYGIPGMNTQEWQESLDTAIKLNVQHISAYHLTFEKGTPFYLKLKNGELNEISDSESLLQYKLLVNTFKENGFIDYEISNFSKKGFESKHNSSYWTGQNYFGFGPGAHSLVDSIRKWNISNLAQYLNKVNNNSEYYTIENLTEIDKYNEIIMLGLRTRKGVDLDDLYSSINKDIEFFFSKELENQKAKNNIIVEGNFIKISEDNKFITDKIISDFFMI